MKKSIMFEVLFALIVFGIFYYFSTLTPLAGDDWGYAVNGAKGAFSQVFVFYETWSGRFFSELYGLLVTPHKEVWNNLNPLLFATIFFVGLRFVDSKHGLLSTVLLFFLMFSVKDELRMQTYTWLMGTTYVIPLTLYLIYLYLLKKIFQKKLPVNYVIYALMIVLSFYVSMTIENIALIMILTNVFMLIYAGINSENHYSLLVLLGGIVSSAGFALMRLSPGSKARLLGETHWLELSFFEKVSENMGNLIKFSFLNNKYLMLVLLTVLIVWFYQKRHRIGSLFFYVPVGFLSIGYLFIASLSLLDRLPVVPLNKLFALMADPNSTLSTLYWIPFALLLLVISFMKSLNDRNPFVFLLVLMAAGANASMLVSPIFGDRSSLYTVYLLFLVILMFLSDLDIKGDLLAGLLGVLLLVGSAKELLVLKDKYELVNQIENERLYLINDYKNHPDWFEGTLWIPRFPIYTIHSGDVEEWDTYHMEVYRKYYGIEGDVEVKFFWKESY